ncbi:hypothetical protein QOZ98_001325 [Planomicrobium stackebrandtii]|uniref:Uncharacterized protein n=1 Tax=Planomicrobium stackebrandtii TaxID=253160 RepID=A0ABU0GU96_9BACL|nr:hypothetical protein [Planomicrobium stackebrandtii]MDQ0428499.1 hypothetical protein [Planomicrobium stackebrandtii]
MGVIRRLFFKRKHLVYTAFGDDMYYKAVGRLCALGITYDTVLRVNANVYGTEGHIGAPQMRNAAQYDFYVAKKISVRHNRRFMDSFGISSTSKIGGLIMEIGFYMLMAIIGVGFLLLAGFDIYRKSQIKLAEIHLERDKIALEQKQLELGRKVHR